jgi:hypothetical protein
MSTYVSKTTKDLDVLRKNMPEVVSEMNKYLDERRKMEAKFWGLNEKIKLVDLFSTSSESQLTMDITKEFQSAWNKSIRKVLSRYSKNNNYQEGSHYDIILDSEEYEIKTTSAFYNKEWSGNKNSINKVGKHILIKYRVGDYHIDGVCVFIIDLSKTSETKWIPGSSSGTSFSVLKIHNNDLSLVEPLMGQIISERRSHKWASPIIQELTYGD